MRLIILAYRQLSKVDIFSSTINKKEVKNDNDTFTTVYEFKPGVTSKETYKIKKVDKVLKYPRGLAATAKILFLQEHLPLQWQKHTD